MFGTKNKPMPNYSGATIPTTFRLKEFSGVRYRAPNQNQCKECHQVNKAMTPIGPKARNMNMI